MPRKRGLTALALGIALATSCGSPAPPTRSPTPPAPTPQAHAFTMQVPDLPTLSNWAFPYPLFSQGQLIVTRMVHAAVYRQDASLAPVPDLAAELCDVASDGVTVTCKLRSATFHDGSPVTADDVAFMYDLARSPECSFLLCLSGPLAGVEAVDSQTVRFTLARPYAPFLSVGLSDVLIEPRARILAGYETFEQTSRGAAPEPLRQLAGGIRDGLQAPQPDCESSLDAGEQALRDLGVALADRRLFVVPRGSRFDPCTYADYLAILLDQAASSIASDGVDAIAAAYPLLPFISFNEKPIGAGPWRLREFDPETGLVLEANDTYHFGRPVTPEVVVRIMRDEEAIAQALAAGEIDWRQFGPAAGAGDPIEGVKVAQYPALAYLALQFNVRPGRIFADRKLRQAVELCIDKERTVRATIEFAVPIYSPIPPGSWAYQPGLAKERDVQAARKLIEASGWIEGADGIYELDGRRLSAQVPVRADIEPPGAFLDRVAVQVRDCGIELIPRPVEFRDAFAMIDTFPHLVPGTDEPFDAYMGGWALSYDPDVFDIFHSSRVTSEARTGGQNLNYIGFSNAEADRLLEAGLEEYDLARRTDIYRDLQRLLAEEQPYLFAFAVTFREALDADLTSTAGELDLGSPNWWWQLETLLNPSE
jgi:ABC-type transport system substrate-binding protein